MKTDGTAMQNIIEVEGLGYAVGGSPILDAVSFTVPPSGFLSILGPSGCGKTTILRLLGGLLDGYEGTIRVAGREPEESYQRTAYVFQSPRLLPWATALDNVLLAAELRMERRVNASDRGRAQELLQLVGLADLGDRFPAQMSGGEQQRVSIARALMVDPDVILMDEPLASLDVAARARVRQVVLQAWQLTGKSVVMVTHNIEEALEMGQSVILLSEKPTHIIDQFHVEHAYPRDVEHQADLKAMAKQVRAAFPNWDENDEGGTERC